MVISTHLFHHDILQPYTSIILGFVAVVSCRIFIHPYALRQTMVLADVLRLHEYLYEQLNVQASFMAI